MKIVLSRADILEKCRRAAGYEPRLSQYSVERTDGIDLDATLEPHIRAWYLDLLDHGPELWVRPDSVAETAKYTPLTDTGGMEIALPAGTRRVFDVRFPLWSQPAQVLPPDKAALAVQMQLNPFTAATPSRPVAVLIGGGNVATPLRMQVWPAAPESRPSVLNVALDSGSDTYSFDDAALGSLTTYLKLAISNE